MLCGERRQTQNRCAGDEASREPGQRGTTRPPRTSTVFKNSGPSCKMDSSAVFRGFPVEFSDSRGWYPSDRSSSWLSVRARSRRCAAGVDTPEDDGESFCSYANDSVSPQERANTTTNFCSLASAAVSTCSCHPFFFALWILTCDNRAHPNHPKPQHSAHKHQAK